MGDPVVHPLIGWVRFGGLPNLPIRQVTSCFDVHRTFRSVKASVRRTSSDSEASASGEMGGLALADVFAMAQFASCDSEAAWDRDAPGVRPRNSLHLAALLFG